MDIKIPLIVENRRCGVYLLILSKKGKKNYWMGPGQYLYEISSSEEEHRDKINELLREYGSVLLSDEHLHFKVHCIEFLEDHLQNGIHKVTPVKL